MVIDCNDLPPVFTPTDHSFTISERSAAAAANEDVYTSISVTDQDGTAANRMVNYRLAGGLSSTNYWLDINSASVSKSINPQYSLVISSNPQQYREI